LAANLASVLFSAYRRDVLTLLFLNPEASFHVREIARLTGKIPGTLLRELKTLSNAGLLVRKQLGNQVHFQANPTSPIYEDLRNILKKTAGMADVLREGLESLRDQIAVAFIYGSMARGDERATSDLDVMLIGKIEFGDAIEALAKPREILRREINPALYSPEEFRTKLASGEPFLKRVMSDKKFFLMGDEHDLGQLASYRKTKAARHRQGGDRASARSR
jgi:predicted nucleotidyltransferase